MIIPGNTKHDVNTCPRFVERDEQAQHTNTRTDRGMREMELCTDEPSIGQKESDGAQT